MVWVFARCGRLGLMWVAPDAPGWWGSLRSPPPYVRVLDFMCAAMVWSGNSDGGMRGCPMLLALCCGHACRMPDYRRMWVPGGTYFFTVNLADRSRRLLAERFEVLRSATCAVRRRHPFEIVAWVAMPNHLHAVWTMLDGDHDFALRWMLIKQSFARAMRVDDQPGGRIRDPRCPMRTAEAAIAGARCRGRRISHASVLRR